MMKTEEEIREMVAKANRLQKAGNYEEVLDRLFRASEEISLSFPEGRVKQSLFGLVYHYTGSTLQRMGQYDKAIVALGGAVEFRQNDLIAKAYSAFQLFICKIYGKITISDEEVEETKAALTAAMANNAATTTDIGNFMQNIAYIEQVKGSVEKAVAFYKMALVMREEAEDARGYALTQARLAECYKELGKDTEARKYGSLALKYFKETGDIERIRQVESALVFSMIFTSSCLISSWLKFPQRG